VELASAVSSLSESKLNALGLCVSIASALRSPGPLSFLIIDDPIQSWDDEHENQFIEVIRSLVEQEYKQVVVLSHNSRWIKTVCTGCASINGVRYEISGYDQDGPHVLEVDWAPIDQRFRHLEAIASSVTSSTVSLQQAEEEIRIVVCKLAADVAKRKLSSEKSPHSMNSQDVRNILAKAGCPDALLDKVVATFNTTDDAHHAPKLYQPSAQRLRQYIAVLRELREWLTQTLSEKVATRTASS
jgi:ABC-type methionine transport system ATPase subunit